MRTDELWGFCDPCESWLRSTLWFNGAGGGRASCPLCGESPSLLEEWKNGTARVTVLLRLPPGAVEPAL